MQLEQIGKYKILEKIGQGAMGEVYKAHDAILNRMVAVKTISAALAGDDTLRKRFQREAQSAARLNHPNIITVYDFGEEHDKIYMAMELLEGHDLKHAIAHHSLETLDQRLDLMAQICDGLAFAHANDVVHRDLKPANIHVQPNGQIKIMDFGLARLGGSEMTRTGMVMGTPHYMSPEQVRGERADARSDIFSLGCVFYELLANRKPFDADSMHAVLFKVMQEDPPALSDVARDVPFVLMEVTERALDKDPGHRYQDAGELRTALHLAQQAIVEGRGEEPLPPLPARESRTPAAPAAAPAGGPGSEVRREPGSSVRGQSASSLRSSSALRSASGSRPRSRPPASRSVISAPAPPPAPAKLPFVLMGVIGIAVLAVLGIGLYVAFGPSSTPSSVTSTTRPSQVDNLARELAGTQVEIARKRLQVGDFKEAAKRAEGALRFDPLSKDAQDILTQARKVLDAVDEAAAATTRAKATGDAGRTAEALWSLMLLEPTHPLVAELAAAHEARLREKLPEARRVMAAARAEADKARATQLDTYREGVAAANAAEAAVKASQTASALRRFLEARALFERARLSV